MPPARLKTSGSATHMKSNERIDSMDTIFGQEIGKDPFLSFTRAGDSPITLFQFLQGIAQPDSPGLALFSHAKVDMQKCEKCSLEFCSTTNYRRHIRLHRRSLNLNKDSGAKIRECLQIYWDKLSADVSVEVLSFKDVSLEEVTGSSIVRALSSFIRQPGFSYLPQTYVKAGSALLDIIQGRPSRFPLTAKELFGILDDASENTFLCAGTAESLKKFIFDGEAGKVALETRNLIACTSFLIEDKLVKAWVADKDAEALRCQKMLVEEEEAAQKRLAALLEKKRIKKLRQKEQKMKEQLNEECADFVDDVATTTNSIPSPPAPSHMDVSDTDSQAPNLLQISIPLLDEPDQVNVEENVNNESRSDSDEGFPDSGPYQNVDHRAIWRNGRRNLVKYHWQGSKVQRPNGSYMGPNHRVMKVIPAQKQCTHRDSRSGAAAKVSKVWTPKAKLEADEQSYTVKLQSEPPKLWDGNKDSKLLIGSISVSVGNQSTQQKDEIHGTPGDGSIAPISPKKIGQERSSKPEKIVVGVSRSTVKLWRPVSRNGNGASIPVENGIEEAKVDALSCTCGDDLGEVCPTDMNNGGYSNNSNLPVEEEVPLESFTFSSNAVEAFLAQRWKEAMASDHVKLVLFPESEPPGPPRVQDDHMESPSVSDPRTIYGEIGNGPSNSKLAAKTEKDNKVRYVPKQKCLA